MAFPRRFKREIWYLRLPSGEVEIVTANALQRAFECGLVDVRTSVRAFGAHAWTTMAEAAELEVPGSPSWASLSAMAFDAPAADLGGGAPWQSRQDMDPRAFKPSRTRAVVAVFASVSLIAIALLGGEVAASPSVKRAAIVPQPLSFEVARPPMRELLRTPKGEDERLTKDQRRRLRELDYVTSTQRRKASSPTPFLPKQRVRSSEDPFARSTRATASPGDPLDGSI